MHVLIIMNVRACGYFNVVCVKSNSSIVYGSSQRRGSVMVSTDRQTGRKHLFDPSTMCFNHDSQIRPKTIAIITERKYKCAQYMWSMILCDISRCSKVCNIRDN